MLGNKTQLVIGKLTGTWSSGCRTDDSTSPRSPLDFQIQSPRTRARLKSYDLGGVGLGIVAALGKSGDFVCPNKAVFGQNLNRSSPIPVKPALNCDSSRYREGLESEETDSDDDLEDYTFVTCRGPNKSCTRRVVYCDSRTGFDSRSKNDCGFSIFDITPARFGEEITAYPAPDFLSCCHLCRKKLHGKDIYIYRGEKGFCSAECRYRQIMMDERKEKCSSEASRSADGVSNSPYTNGQIFSPGIFAI